MNASTTRPSSSALEHERRGSYVPGHAVEVEDLGALELGLVGEARRLCSAICLEIRRFQRHLRSRVPAASDALASAYLRAMATSRAVHDRADLGPALRRPVLPARTCSSARSARSTTSSPDIVICSGDLTTFGFKEEYARGEGLPRPDRVRRRSSSSPATTTRGTSATSTSRSCSATGTRSLHVGRRHRRRRRLDRARPRPRPDRTRPLPLDRGAVRRRRPTCAIFVLHHHLLPVPGHGPRAERRLRRRRRDRVPAARGRRTSSSPGTSTSRTRGGSRTCSSSTPARSRRCGSGATRAPVTT